MSELADGMISKIEQVACLNWTFKNYSAGKLADELIPEEKQTNILSATATTSNTADRT